MMRLYRGKIVATVHHPFAWHFGTLGGVKGSWRRQHLLRQIQRGFCHVDGVIVLTPAEVPLYKTQLPHALVRFIPHGVKDYRRFATKGSKEPGQLRICVVGQTYRDIDMVESLVRRAVAEKKQWLFHLIGFRSPISEALVSSGLVRMEPRLDEPEYLSLLGSCDINLLPLTHATANNALLEAHSVGTPTLISDLSEVEAYRLPSTQGFGDAEEAWQILVRAEEDRPWLAGLREMTRDESPRFHWQHIAASVEQLYADVMA
jgi:glycosyltransferase involved in cell wall biosynthesis